LIAPLFGGMAILLNGKSNQLAIKIEWNDKFFENKYEFTKRFQGEFFYWDYIEVFMAAKIIQRYNERLFEDIKTSLIINYLLSERTIFTKTFGKLTIRS